MSNPQGPDQPDEVTDEVTEAGDDEAADGAEPATEVMASSEPDHEPATEVISADLSNEAPEEPERRFTAPSGFDAGATTRINTPSEPATEVMATAPAPVAKTRFTTSHSAAW